MLVSAKFESMEDGEPLVRVTLSAPDVMEIASALHQARHSAADRVEDEDVLDPGDVFRLQDAAERAGEWSALSALVEPLFYSYMDASCPCCAAEAADEDGVQA